MTLIFDPLNLRWRDQDYNPSVPELPRRAIRPVDDQLCDVDRRKKPWNSERCDPRDLLTRVQDASGTLTARRPLGAICFKS
jgi:hypothetical protein